MTEEALRARRDSGRPFTAALLAGGVSRRMGQDKGALLLHGVPLRERQLSVLRALGPEALMLCGPGKMPGVVTVADLVPGSGPLGGIAGALEQIATERVLVLAIDLPRMSAELLRGLLGIKTDGGVIPRGERGFEPLAAIYTRAALPLARESSLAAGRLRLQAFAEGLVERGLAVAWPIQPGERGYFENANTPAEWDAIRQRAGEDSSR